jgi:hypothetical protein
MKGCDYSFARPDIHAMRQAGIQFVMRYVTGRQKAITSLEFKALRAHGMAVGFVFEGDTGDYARGRAKGRANARAAQTVLHNGLGVPKAVCYFAVDTDIFKASQFAQVREYFNGIRDVIPNDRVGVYGDDEAYRFSGAKFYWRARGWRHPHSNVVPHIDQYLNGAKIGGAEVDLDKTVRTPAGLVGAPLPVPPPKPKPVPVPPKPKPTIPAADPKQPKPMPGWWWEWANWRRGGRKGPRPASVPRVIAPWAWVALVRYNLKHPIQK